MSSEGGKAPPVLNIIGCGRAAVSLSRLWLQAGAVRVGSVLNRSAESTARAVERLGSGSPAASLRDMKPADCWLIGCSDDQVESVAQTLANDREDLQGRLVFHLAGRFGREVLAAVEQCGADTAALHPVRSLTFAPLKLDDFRGTACLAECAAAATDRLRQLVEAAGGSWHPVGPIDRGLYHASVSIISNITKAVAWKAQNWLQHAGLSAATAESVTHQLLHSTMQDLFRSGARQSITGPVVRGDTRTIEAHLAALAGFNPEDSEIYRVLARTVLELARERGDLAPEVLARFSSILDA